jgi:hypothetical protein
MSLRKSPTLTPARLAANRRNAQKSTGPRTAWGKSWSRLNGLRDGSRSRRCQDLVLSLLDAPPCAVDRTARALLGPAEAAHPTFSEFVDLARQAEIEVVCGCRALKGLRGGASRKKDVKKSTSEARMSFRINGRFWRT